MDQKQNELYFLWLVVQENQEFRKRNKTVVEETLKALLRTLEIKDRYTHGHSQRVAFFARLIAENMGFEEEEIQEIKLAAMLHDLGKIGTPLEILNKPGKLTDEEFDVIKEHPIYSYEIISQVSSLQNIARWIRAHQERMDGFGYPDGLKGEEIPLQARIITVADAFDAMTSDRPYRKALSLETAYEELKRCAGTQFDKEVVKVFLDVYQNHLAEKQVRKKRA
ncbi:MAG: HD-GYP domain-containing protein [Deltaproteobacteria bacterium]|nr:HD-GYP domain-containing protein [Deltaproteobacteria bacterium]